MKTSSSMLGWTMCGLASVLFLTGCVGVTPRPVSSKVERGHKPVAHEDVVQGYHTVRDSSGLGTDTARLYAVGQQIGILINPPPLIVAGQHRPATVGRRFLAIFSHLCPEKTVGDGCRVNQPSERNGWPVSTPEAYPAVLRFEPGRPPQSPSGEDLEYIESCL